MFPVGFLRLWTFWKDYRQRVKNCQKQHFTSHNKTSSVTRMTRMHCGWMSDITIISCRSQTHTYCTYSTDSTRTCIKTRERLPCNLQRSSKVHVHVSTRWKTNVWLMELCVGWFIDRQRVQNTLFFPLFTTCNYCCYYYLWTTDSLWFLPSIWVKNGPISFYCSL